MKTKARLAMICATIFWGATFLVTQNLLAEISALQILAFRFGLAALILFPLVHHRMRKKAKTLPWKEGGLLGILLFSSFFFQTLGLQYTTTGRSGFISFLFAVFIPPLQLIFLKIPVKRNQIWGLFIVLTGMLFLTRPGMAQLNVGDLLTLGCSVSFAFFVLLMDPYSKRQDPLALAFIQFAFASLLAFVISLILEPLTLPQTTWGWTGLLYLAIPATTISLLIQSRFQKELDPTEAALLFALEPIIALILGITLLLEPFGLPEIAGFTLVLGGVLFSELPGQHQKNKKSRIKTS